MPDSGRLGRISPQSLRGLRAWVGRSILNRLTAISMGTSVLLLIAVALVAFPLFYGLARSNIEAHGRNNLERAHDQVRFRVSALLESLQHLAGNSFVVNAFVDSTGRELYLLPTLRDYRVPFGLNYTLTLLDSNLSIFGDSRPDSRLAPEESQLAQDAMTSGKSRLAFHDRGGRMRLVIAVPVFYPPAKAYEGVLLSSVDTAELLRPATEGLKPSQCLTVKSGALVLLSTACRPEHQARVPLSMQGALTDPSASVDPVTLSFADTDDAPYGLLFVVVAVYGLLSALALALVYAATRWVGRPFASKLDELAHAAHALAADPTSTARARWDLPDEIGHLTLAFDALVAKWREIQASLEARVEQRTGQLALALEHAHESSRAKSEFLALMSHEIRTPMNGVVGMIQALETTPLNDAQQRQLQVIRGSSDLLLRIIDDLLDFSKIEAGKLALEVVPTRVDHLLQDLVASLQPAAEARGIELHLDLPAGALSQPLGADATRLRQVLANLVHNAIKFTNAGGRADLVVTARAQGGRCDILFEVRDSGIGIEADQLQRIFDPFEQAERSTTRRFGGTGLGLAIVKRLVALMDGSIDVDSRPGEGSRFAVRLNLPVVADVAAQPFDAASKSSTQFNALRLLVVEDNPTNQIVAVALLNSLGVEQITVADSGQDALVAASRQEFDLVLMDIQMPDMDGYATTLALRHAGVTAPIVAMTANVLPADRAAYRAAGLVDCVAKPMDRNMLQAMIARRCGAGADLQAG